MSRLRKIQSNLKFSWRGTDKLTPVDDNPLRGRNPETRKVIRDIIEKLEIKSPNLSTLKNGFRITYTSTDTPRYYSYSEPPVPESELIALRSLLNAHGFDDRIIARRGAGGQQNRLYIEVPFGIGTLDATSNLKLSWREETYDTSHDVYDDEIRSVLSNALDFDEMRKAISKARGIVEESEDDDVVDIYYDINGDNAKVIWTTSQIDKFVADHPGADYDGVVDEFDEIFYNEIFTKVEKSMTSSLNNLSWKQPIEVSNIHGQQNWKKKHPEHAEELTDLPRNKKNNVDISVPDLREKLGEPTHLIISKRKTDIGWRVMLPELNAGVTIRKHLPIGRGSRLEIPRATILEEIYNDDTLYNWVIRGEDGVVARFISEVIEVPRTHEAYVE